MNIDIITPYYKALRFFDSYIKSIERLDVPDGCTVRLYLVDNESPEGEIDKLKGITILSNGITVNSLHYSDKQSSYAARNHGVKHSSGELIFFTDIDCIPSQDWLVNGVSNVKYGYICSGSVKFFSVSESKIDKVSGEFDSLYFLRNDFNSLNETGVTANACIFREDFLSVGFFDEKASGADHAYFLRAKNYGLTFFYNKDSIVHHPTRGFADIITKLNRVCLGKVQNDYKVTIWGEFLKFIVNSIFLNLLKTGALKELKAVDVIPVIFLSFIFNAVCRFYLVKYKFWSQS